MIKILSHCQNHFEMMFFKHHWSPLLWKLQPGCAFYLLVLHADLNRFQPMLPLACPTYLDWLYLDPSSSQTASTTDTVWYLSAVTCMTECLFFLCRLVSVLDVGWNCFQLSAVHRVWYGFVKIFWWLSSRSLSVCTNLPLYHLQTIHRPPHGLHYVWLEISTLLASFPWFYISQMRSAWL